MEARNIPPHKPGTQIASHTIPTITLPNGTHIMESNAIAKYIEKQWPAPNVHLDSETSRLARKGWTKVMAPLQAVLVPRMPEYTLREPSASYHRVARHKTYGMSLSEYEAKYGGEKAWNASKPGFVLWAELLRRDDSGPYCMGKEVSYADFWIVAFFEFARNVQGDSFDRIMQMDSTFPRLYDACKVWLERNDR